MLQIEGSKNARLGILFNADPNVGSPGLLFVKAYEVAASSHRYSSPNLS